MKLGSLFSGAGLCDYGFSMAGFEHVFFCECNEFCQKILARRWRGVPIYNDVATLRVEDLPKVDVLVGGFPCQDISCAGLRKGINKETRSGLWYEYARIIKNMRPRYAVVENVPGLRSKGLEIVLGDLSSFGYDAEWQTVSAASLGAPHLRERLFVVAYPHRDGDVQEPRLLFESPGNIFKLLESRQLPAWPGIGIAGQGKEATRAFYSGAALCRMDDGNTGRMDGPVKLISRDELKLYKARLMALANGIVPLQAWYVAMCIKLDMKNNV